MLYVHAALFTFAHLALCAAAIFFLAATDIVRFGFAVLVFAHRAFCARLIFLRPAADIVRDAPFELPPSAASASSMRWSCCCVWSRSFFNCRTTMDMCFILGPLRNDSRTRATPERPTIKTYGWRANRAGISWRERKPSARALFA
jgi:hypothetical protein